MINPAHPILSVRIQRELLDLARASQYYQPRTISPRDEYLMRLLDEHYTEHPYAGKIKRSLWLTLQVGYPVGVRKVRTLMAYLGLETLYPKPDTSVSNKAHDPYPYLLRDKCIDSPNQVWAADITYVRLNQRHAYLFAIMDWYSRYVVAWCVMPTLEADGYVDTLIQALSQGHCEIFNTDQGAQFTSNDWIKVLTDEGISISMDGRGRYLDNIFVERLWRTVKQECLYLTDFKTIEEIELALEKYFKYYNDQRMHQGLAYRTPAQIYFQVK